MPTLEPQSSDQDYPDTEYAVTDPALELPPERPQRIPVPPIMLWGALWLVAISVTVAATATLLLPRRLNSPLSQPTAQNNVLEQLESSPKDTSQDAAAQESGSDARATPETTPTAQGLPAPPPAAAAASPAETVTAESPAEQPKPDSPTDSAPTGRNSEPPEAATTPTETAQTQTNAAELQAPSPARRLFPLRLLLLVTAGCAFTSLVVTLVLRGVSQQAAPRAARRERLATQTNLAMASPPRHSSASPVSRMHPQAEHHTRPHTQPHVMVLPPEAVTPLDGIPADSFGDLAAQLDIRRRYSLSSLIEEDLDSV
ncbi:MAG: hypothetical protein AAGG51_10125 [Cyanobacteria bacterium P01_G01_bin.54]